jgi:biotin carboxyl carrier protein
LRYEVEVGGRLRSVSIHRADGKFVVDVDGQASIVDAARVDGQTLSLLLAGASHDITIVSEPASGRLVVSLAGVSVPVALNRRRRPHREEGSGGAGSGPDRMVAPMPGKVVRLLVKLGDLVRKRQPVIVVEAMKMENELRASQDGTVAELHVKEGQSVEAGALLLVVVPA